MRQDAEQTQQPPSAAEAFTKLEEAIIAVQRAAYGEGGRAAVEVRSLLANVVCDIENNLLAVDERSDESEVRDVFRRLREMASS
jgi:protein-disulfide isomerase-like protein with CxxC motif